MKHIFSFVAAASFTLMVACSSKTDTNAVQIDTVTEGETEVALESVGSDSAAVEAVGDGVVRVLSNSDKAEAAGKPLVIDFSATWCGPCQRFKPTFHAVAEQYAAKADFATADVDECVNLAQKYQVESIPFVLIIKPDGTTDSSMGLLSEAEFKAFLDKNLK